MRIARTKHFVARLKQRLRDCGIPFSEISQELAAVLNTEWNPHRSYAVRLKDLGKFFGPCDVPYLEREESNGEVLWLIIRPDAAGVPSLVTFFFRRRNQPSDPRRFSVDMVIDAKKLIRQSI